LRLQAIESSAVGQRLIDGRLAEAAGHVLPVSQNKRGRTPADYERHLALTPEQVERLKPVFGVTGQKLRTLRANTAEHVAELVKEMNQQVMPALNPEQQAKLRKLLEERSRAFQQR
jgi:hypothetical protein